MDEIIVQFSSMVADPDVASTDLALNDSAETPIADAAPGAAAWCCATAAPGAALSMHATPAAVIDASRRLSLITLFSSLDDDVRGH
ncbi:hypothetical protein [Streptomyces mirabilis]|uniref:hypothetical protein n=1 Tax=Streptomyces mirabilis TaxID=68239 RepID=UPI0033D943F3